MRYSLLATASLIAVAFAVPASAEDCGCRDAVRAALAKPAPTVQRAPLAVVQPQPRRTAARVARRTTGCNCGPAPRPAPAAANSGGYYDYGAARAVDSYGYSHHWTSAPQGYVPPAPMAMGGPMVPAYDGPADLPPYGPEGATAYDAGYGEAYAYGPAPVYGQGPAITVEQQGWFGGVGYGAGGGGGGGGGGGMTLTLSQPDAGNGPSYNSFGQSYGGDYQAAGQVNQFRAQAFAPKPAAGSK